MKTVRCCNAATELVLFQPNFVSMKLVIKANAMPQANLNLKNRKDYE